MEQVRTACRISGVDAPQICLPPHSNPNRPTSRKIRPSKKRKEPPASVEQADDPKTVEDMPSTTKVTDITYNQGQQSQLIYLRYMNTP